MVAKGRMKCFTVGSRQDRERSQEKVEEKERKELEEEERKQQGAGQSSSRACPTQKSHIPGLFPFMFVILLKLSLHAIDFD